MQLAQLDKSKIKNGLIGLDPEMLILSSGKIISERDDYNNSEMSLDGNGIASEIRVAPSKNPLKLVNNIHGIFRRKIKRYPNYLKYKWVAGSHNRNQPLGGHIHFQMTEFVQPDPRTGQYEYRSFTRILDNYLGCISILIEDTDEGIKRRSHGYGSAGDTRAQSYGMEYRTCSSFLVSPYVSAAFLCLAKTVMFEALNNPNFDFRRGDCTDYINLMQVNKVRAVFPKIWADITQMMLYQTYKPYLDLLYFLISKKRTWFFKNAGMKELWGIIPNQPIQDEEVSLDVIWMNWNNSNVRLAQRRIPRVGDNENLLWSAPTTFTEGVDS